MRDKLFFDNWKEFTIQKPDKVILNHLDSIKNNIDDDDPGVVQVTATPSVSTNPTEASQGILYINVARNLANSLTAQTYHYDVQQKDTSGDVQTLLIGKVKVVKDVTRTVS